jgi:hypothetical protein
LSMTKSPRMIIGVTKYGPALEAGWLMV